MHRCPHSANAHNTGHVACNCAGTCALDHVLCLEITSAGTMATGSGPPSVQARSSALAVAIAQHVGGANNQSSNASLAPSQAAPTVQHAPQLSTSVSAGSGRAEPSRYVLPLMILKIPFPVRHVIVSCVLGGMPHPCFLFFSEGRGRSISLKQRKQKR